MGMHAFVQASTLMKWCVWIWEEIMGGRLRSQELEWAAHLSLQACILPLPQTLALANYARILNQVGPWLSRHLKAKAGTV